MYGVIYGHQRLPLFFSREEEGKPLVSVYFMSSPRGGEGIRW